MINGKRVCGIRRVAVIMVVLAVVVVGCRGVIVFVTTWLVLGIASLGFRGFRV